MAIQRYYGTVEEYVDYWCVTTCDQLTGQERLSIERSLTMAAGMINMAISTQGAQDCAFSEAAEQSLQMINFIMAAVTFNCRCASPNLATDEKQMWLRWIDDQLAAIRDGRVELCDGETGTEYPSAGIAQQVHTVWQADQLRYNSGL
jgi:hypothetical protein